MAKNLFLVLVTLCLLATGCNDDEKFSDVMLEQTELLDARLNETYSIRITQGSGDYSVEIDRPKVANVKIEPTYGAGTRLWIETKAGGAALITLTDNKTGKFITCSLFVQIPRIELNSVRYAVEAEQPAVIEADLAANSYPEGTHFIMVPLTFTLGTTGEWGVQQGDRDDIETGTYTVIEFQGAESHQLLPLETQIVSMYGLQIDMNDKRLTYDVFLARSRSRATGGSNYVDIFFYEDMTEHYQKEFPDAGVRAVVRVYTHQWQAIKE